jgi:hypothetical protein
MHYRVHSILTLYHILKQLETVHIILVIGGIVVRGPATWTRVHTGSKLAENDGILIAIKIRSTSSFGWEAGSPMS